MPKVLVDIPEQLMSDALEVSGPKATKAGTVREALALLVATYRQQQMVQWVIDEDPLADLRNDEVRSSARR